MVIIFEKKHHIDRKKGFYNLHCQRKQSLLINVFIHRIKNHLNEIIYLLPFSLPPRCLGFCRHSTDEADNRWNTAHIKSRRDGVHPPHGNPSLSSPQRSHRTNPPVHLFPPTRPASARHRPLCNHAHDAAEVIPPVLESGVEPVRRRGEQHGRHGLAHQ